jgi:hypothetical protein
MPDSEIMVYHTNTDSEIMKYHTYRHSFPHVVQQLYPSVRPDGISGQFRHFTQIPKHVTIDPDTGLSSTYQIVIRFDSNYRDLTKQDAQEAANAHLEMMRIPLATRFREPVSTIIDKDSAKWLGFLRIDILNPQIDGLALLCGEKVFTMQLLQECVVRKVEKGFDFKSTATNKKLKIQRPNPYKVKF